MDRRREDAEAEYHAALVAALKVTAAGQWGLFGHNKSKTEAANAAPMLAELDQLAEEIDDLREKLGLEPFALHAEFLQARGPVSSHAVGEPKQAQAWLAKLQN